MNYVECNVGTAGPESIWHPLQDRLASLNSVATEVLRLAKKGILTCQRTCVFCTWKASCIWFQSSWKSPRTGAATWNSRPCKTYVPYVPSLERKQWWLGRKNWQLFFLGLCCNQCWSACRIRKLVEVLSFEPWEVFNQSYFESLSWTGSFGRWKVLPSKHLRRQRKLWKNNSYSHNFWMTKGPSLPKSYDKSVQGGPLLKSIC